MDQKSGIHTSTLNYTRTAEKLSTLEAKLGKVAIEPSKSDKNMLKFIIFFSFNPSTYDPGIC